MNQPKLFSLWGIQPTKPAPEAASKSASIAKRVGHRASKPQGTKAEQALLMRFVGLPEPPSASDTTPVQATRATKRDRTDETVQDEPSLPKRCIVSSPLPLPESPPTRKRAPRRTRQPPAPREERCTDNNSDKGPTRRSTRTKRTEPAYDDESSSDEAAVEAAAIAEASAPTRRSTRTQRTEPAYDDESSSDEAAVEAAAIAEASAPTRRSTRTQLTDPKRAAASSRSDKRRSGAVVFARAREAAGSSRALRMAVSASTASGRQVVASQREYPRGQFPTQTPHVKLVTETIEASRKGFYTMEFDRFGSKLGAAGAGGLAVVFDRAGSILASWTAHSRWVSSISFVYAGGHSSRIAVTTADDSWLRVWDLSLDPTGEPSLVAEAAPHDGCGIYSLSIGQQCATTVELATVGKDGALCVAELQGNGTLRSLYKPHMAHSGVAKAVAFRGWSQVLATAGNDKVVALWDVRSKPEACGLCGGDSHWGMDANGRPMAHQLAVNKLVWTADGMLVSGSFDNTIQFWDPRRLDAPVLAVRSFGSQRECLAPIKGRPKRADSMIQPMLFGGGHLLSFGVDQSTNLRTVDHRRSEALDWSGDVAMTTACSDGCERLAVPSGSCLAVYSSEDPDSLSN
jgi:hypothetical protein